MERDPNFSVQDSEFSVKVRDLRFGIRNFRSSGLRV